MKPIRVIVVGCGGGRGSWFTGELIRHQKFQLVALVDRLPETAHIVARHHQIPDVPVFSDTSEALCQVDCDAVVVATTDCEHAEPTVAALQRGKHVYVEKPLSTSLDDCLAIIRADNAVGRRTMVGFNLRFAPLYHRMHQLITDGDIGRVLTIQADEFYYNGRTYFRRWNRLRKFGGGLWLTKASHDFDLLFWMSGTLPERISAGARLSHYTPRPDAALRCRDCALTASCPDASSFNPHTSRGHHAEIAVIRENNGWAPADLCLYNSDKDTFDHGIAQVEFTNEILATYTVNVVSAITDRRMRISGTDGILEGNLDGADILYWKRHDNASPEHLPLYDPSQGPIGGHGGGDACIFDDFANFVHGLPSRAIGPAEASVAVAMGLAATRASDTGMTIEMDTVAGWRELCENLPISIQIPA